LKLARDTLLGLVFGGGLVLLILGTIFLSELAYGRTDAIPVVFETAYGLKSGDPANVSGVKKGYVKDVDLDQAAPRGERVRVKLELQRDVKIHVGYRIVIEQASLLGGRVVAIDPGDPTKELIAYDDANPLRGEVAKDPIKSITDLVEENRATVKEGLAAARDMFRAASSGQGIVARLLNDKTLADRVSKVVEDVDGIVAGVARGEGTLGKLFKDDKIARDIESLTGKLDRGEGLLGRLISDHDLRDRFDRIVADIESTTSKISRGEGSLGKFIHTSEAHDKLTSILDKVNSSEGLLGRLISDKEMGDDAKEFVASARDIASTIRRGEGTVGRLVKDDSLYRNLERVFRSLGRSIEDAREAAPIATFSSVLFGAF
jgi:phospholipid/cholesterol/gamma-HCH transport system substrate-binding protein